MVYANTTHPAEAAEFAINMFGAEDNSRAAAWGIQYNTKLSPRASVIEDNAEFYTQFPHDVFANEIFPTARPEPSYPPEIAQAVWEAIQDAMFNNVSGADAAATWAGKIEFLSSDPLVSLLAELPGQTSPAAPRSARSIPAMVMDHGHC